MTPGVRQVVILGAGLDTLIPLLGTFEQGIQEGPVVFGGYDGNAYATRIQVVLGCSTTGGCPAPAATNPSTPGGLPPVVQGLLGGIKP